MWAVALASNGEVAAPAGLGGLSGYLTPLLFIIIVGIFLIKTRKSKNRILELKAGETKKNPGVATVLSCLLYCFRPFQT